MRTVLRLLGTRYGIGLILAIVILGVVGIAKAFVGDRTTNIPIGPVVSPVSTAAAPDSSLGDDSVDDTATAVPGPSLSVNAPTADKVAARFMAAWLKHSGVTGEQWRTALKPNATTELLAKLKDTDPASVPADQVTGPIHLALQGSITQADVPVNGGTVHLRLVLVKGRWQVDGIDWDPS
jgi:hypothetical protein